MNTAEWGLTPVEYAQREKERRRAVERGRRERSRLSLLSRLVPRLKPSAAEWPRFVIGLRHGERVAVLNASDGPITLPFISMQFREVR